MDNRTKNKVHHAQPTNAVKSSAHTLVEQGRGQILSDVLGSYTGTAKDDEIPEQDADDL